MELVKLNKNNQIITSSRIIAEKFEKKHIHVLEAIDNKIKNLGGIDNAKHLFIPTTYIHEQNKQEYREYSLTTSGLKFYIDTSRKTKKMKPVVELYNEMLLKEGKSKYNIILVDRFEDSFFKDLQDTLSVMGIELQLQFSVLNYFIDGYLPKYNIAIEYDEIQHNYTIEQDNQRELDISSKIGCKFLRLDYMDTNAINIGYVLKEIFQGGEDE